MEMEKEVEEDANQNDSKPQTVMYGGMNDGNIMLSFSDQKLEAYADFIPPYLNGQPLATRGVTLILDSINIVHGIQWDNISNALDECNIESKQVRGVLIAQGEAPEPEVIEYYERNPKLDLRKPKLDEKGRIDYREFSPFIIVKKGQTLATLRPYRPGKAGTNVHGELIPFNTIRPYGVVSGANTSIKGDKIVSDMHGQLVESKGMFSVQDNLVVKGTVGYRTGHIIFPGDVRIDGQVSDGFKIISGGSITIKQTLDLTEVVAKGDITVLGGIIGKGAALLKAGGGIKTKFIENCRVAARNAVVVDSGIINSNVFTLDTVRIGDKGLILGGEIYSVNGLRSGGIGKKGRKTTRIHCGIDFAALQEKDHCNNRLRILAAKLTRMRSLMGEPGIDSEKRAKMEELCRRLEEEQQTATARITELMGSINANDKATVEVLGEIAPGTLIEICQVALVVEEPLKKVRIRLDPICGKLVAEPM